MSIIEISPEEQQQIFQIVASILHMGNVGFTEEDGQAKILKPESVKAIIKVNKILHSIQTCIKKNFSTIIFFILHSYLDVMKKNLKMHLLIVQLRHVMI